LSDPTRTADAPVRAAEPGAASALAQVGSIHDANRAADGAVGAATRRLKVAFVVDRFGNRYGGAEAYGVELMRQLATQHDITVYARDYDPACDLRLPYVSLRSWKHWPSWVRVLIFAFRAAKATRGQYDIVHSHMNGWCGDIEVIHVTPVRYNWRVRPMPRVKRLLSYVSLRVQAYLSLEARRVAAGPGRRVVAVSGLIADQLRQAYGAGLAAPIIPPGVSLPAPTSTQAREQLRADLKLAPADSVCLLVARNPLRKGLPAVLNALAQLPERYKLMVVGANAATRDFLHKTPQHQALVDRIRLIEETHDVAPYYRAADIYVHPTLNDSFGMAPLEAMSYGLPVILSPRPWCGFAQYVREGEAMMLTHPENHDELAAFIERIDTDDDLRLALIRGGAQVVERHGWREVAGRYAELYREVLTERDLAERGAGVNPAKS
jgi:UDP-glucose:(heptosyl)LPS alpha-1,3-glucosyltransferase